MDPLNADIEMDRHHHAITETMTIHHDATDPPKKIKRNPSTRGAPMRPVILSAALPTLPVSVAEGDVIDSTSEAQLGHDNCSHTNERAKLPTTGSLPGIWSIF